MYRLACWNSGLLVNQGLSKYSTCISISRKSYILLFLLTTQQNSSNKQETIGA
jgi:hypothetical protein